MKAIRISNSIKNKNSHDWVQSRDIGDIVVKSNLPNRFHVTENVVGSYHSRTDLHENDGWRPYIILVDGVHYNIDPSVLPQKLNTSVIVGYPIGEPLATRTHYAYKIIDMTPEENDERNDANETRSARDIVNLYFDQGREIAIDFRLRLYRRTQRDNSDAGYLTKAQVGKMDRWFSATLIALLVGNFREARRLAKAECIDRWDGVFDDGDGNEVAGNATLGEAQAMQFLANKLFDDISLFFDGNYDM